MNAPAARVGAPWRAAQIAGLAAMAALLAGLVWAPEPSLRVLWKVVIPLIPASLLISPLLWRNICPLATLNLLSNRPGGRRSHGRRFPAAAATLGIALLATLVPARRVVFNTDGPALAGTIVAVAMAALILGALFDVKAGFCSGICPVLPVERLYGQSPLIRIGNARCAPCTLCVAACIDLSPEKSIPQLLGRARRGSDWLITPFGAFAAAFPGFVLAYFTATDSPVAAAGAIYLRVLLFSAISYLLVLAVVRAARIPSVRVLPAVGAIAAGIYYWFAASDMAGAIGAAPLGEHLRAAALALVLAWWWRASFPPRARSAEPAARAARHDRPDTTRPATTREDR